MSVFSVQNNEISEFDCTMVTPNKAPKNFKAIYASFFSGINPFLAYLSLDFRTNKDFHNNFLPYLELPYLE